MESVGASGIKLHVLRVRQTDLTLWPDGICQFWCKILENAKNSQKLVSTQSMRGVWWGALRGVGGWGWSGGGCYAELGSRQVTTLEVLCGLPHLQAVTISLGCKNKSWRGELCMAGNSHTQCTRIIRSYAAYFGAFRQTCFTAWTLTLDYFSMEKCRHLLCIYPMGQNLFFSQQIYKF